MQRDMQREELKALIREVVLDVLREYLNTERRTNLARADVVERMLGYAVRTAELRERARVGEGLTLGEKGAIIPSEIAAGPAPPERVALP